MPCPAVISSPRFTWPADLSLRGMTTILGPEFFDANCNIRLLNLDFLLEWLKNCPWFTRVYLFRQYNWLCVKNFEQHHEVSQKTDIIFKQCDDRCVVIAKTSSSMSEEVNRISTMEAHITVIQFLVAALLAIKFLTVLWLFAGSSGVPE